ncbi:TlpA family protein disulfide reductase [Streptomyces flavochromogenes]|uniref:TlpA family protein disulfide reductase n=1 Tax=Streptomyces flavochromogenes TaxID=68199 RepID=UPI00056B2DBA|nr:TlpA disulfide reductase family protein [Streptomyces flavochromogenes]
MTARGTAATVALLLLALAATGCDAGAVAGADGGVPGAGTAGTAAVLPVAERPSAPDTSGRDLTGRDLALRSYRGKVVVLNVWGSWCAPCRDEAADLEALRGAAAPRGVEVLGVNVRDRSTGPAREFERTYGLRYPSIHDPDGKLLLAFPPALLNPQAIPSTLVIDRQGRIAVAVSGPVTRARLEPLVDRVAGEDA